MAIENAISVSVAVSGAEDKEMSLTTGGIAGQAGGAVVGRMGDTQILVAATGAKKPREGASFFPLTVDIEERMYAAGKIPGSFFRREGRASESAILTCRLTDRPLRPAFPKGFRNEVHVVGTVLGADQANPYDVLGINAASAALMISDVPFNGPIGAVRIAYSAEGEWIPHPTYEEGSESNFEMVVAGRLLEDGDVAVSMVEAGGTEGAGARFAEGAPIVDEDVLAGGLEAVKPWIKEVIELQRKLIGSVAAAGNLKEKFEFSTVADYSDEVYDAVSSLGESRIAETQTIAGKKDRGMAESALAETLIQEVGDRMPEVENLSGQVKEAIRSITKKVVRDRVISDGIRIDGRGPTDLRELSSQVAVIDTAHGSGLFTRGETQVLNVTTLGTARMDQMIDGIDPIDRKRYLHHYNFPPYCTGETGFMRGPKRREIGHGALAERALVPVIPTFEEFPYTLRLVSEVMASNGSSSMASVCGSSLSMMDAGVPIQAPVGGIAMGLIHEDGQYVTITDILGAEDAMGDMDFKVAGTRDFVTALQLDTKIDGIPSDVLAAALQQAKQARHAILDSMEDAIAAPNEDVKDYAPRIISFEIPIDKIGEVIGPKGKVINAMQAETGADISVDDDGMVGTVSVASSDRAAVDEAVRQIELIMDPPTPEVGETYQGRVVNITNFGAFVNILPGRDGLLHISKIGGSKRISSVDDVLSLGEEVDVIVEDIDPNGKVSLKPADGSVVSEEMVDGDSGGGGRDDDRGDRGDRGGRSSGGGRSDRGGRDRGDRDRSDRGGRSDSRDSGGDRDGGSRSGSRDGGGGSDRVSFEDAFNEEQKERYGDLGPESSSPDRGRGGGGRGRGRSRGGRGRR